MGSTTLASINTRVWQFMYQEDSWNWYAMSFFTFRKGGIRIKLYDIATPCVALFTRIADRPALPTILNAQRYRGLPVLPMGQPVLEIEIPFIGSNGRIPVDGYSYVVPAGENGALGLMYDGGDPNKEYQVYMAYADDMSCGGWNYVAPYYQGYFRTSRFTRITMNG